MTNIPIEYPVYGEADCVPGTALGEFRVQHANKRNPCLPCILVRKMVLGCVEEKT
jgi:hypothetical protein